MAIVQSASQRVEHEERDVLWERVFQPPVSDHGTELPQVSFRFDADGLQVLDNAWVKILEFVEIRFHDLDNRSQHRDISQLSLGLSLSAGFGT